MSVLKSAFYPAQSFFARWPRLVETALAWLNLSRGASNVLRQIGLSVFGVDERYRKPGVPLSERVLASTLQRARSGIHDAVAELLAKGILVRKPDGERRNAYRYQIAHPQAWVYPEGCGIPAGMNALQPDYVQGWDAPLLRFAPQTRGYCEEEVIPEVINKAPAAAPPVVGTHARSFSEVEEDLNSREISLVDRYWVTIQGKKVSLVELVSTTLGEWCPGWEKLKIHSIEDVPSAIAVRLAQTIPSDRGGWTCLIVRQAIVRASQLSKLLEADREEERRLEADRLEAIRIQRGKDALVLWRELSVRAKERGLKVEATASALRRIEEGNLCELEVAEALLDALEIEVQAWQPPIQPVPVPEPTPVPAPIDASPAQSEHPAPTPKLPGPRRVVASKVAAPPPAPPAAPVQAPLELEPLEAQADRLQAGLETIITPGNSPIPISNVALIRTALEQLQARKADGNPTMLRLAIRLAEGVLCRFAPT